MKRKLSVIMVSLMLLNFSAGLSAKTAQDNGQISNFDFDNFTVESINNIFTGSISGVACSDSSSQEIPENISFICDPDLISPNINCGKIQNDFGNVVLLCNDKKNYLLDRFRNLRRQCLSFDGLTRHRIVLNSYIAQAVTDSAAYGIMHKI